MLILHVILAVKVGRFYGELQLGGWRLQVHRAEAAISNEMTDLADGGFMRPS